MYKMLKKFKKIWSGLTFYSPKKSDLVVFNEASELPLLPVLKGLDYTILSEYPVIHESGKLYLSPHVLLKALFLLKHLNYRQKLYNLRGIYLLSCIQCIKPKVLITTIDNSYAFWWLGAVYQKADFYTIQNGARALSKDWVSDDPHHPGSSITITHYFCFGKFEEALYCSAGHKVKHYYPIGSLSAGVYKFDILKNRELKNEFDICKIGQGTVNFPLNAIDVLTMIKGVDRMLAKYLALNPSRFCVALGPGGSKETDLLYYYPIYGSAVNLMKYDHPYSTYQLVCESHVIVASMSSVGFEALGFGKKVLFADFVHLPNYNVIECSPKKFSAFEELCFVGVEDYDLFESKLNRLRNMPIDEYLDVIEPARKYFMNFDPHNPPQKVIRDKVLECLGKK